MTPQYIKDLSDITVSNLMLNLVFSLTTSNHFMTYDGGLVDTRDLLGVLFKLYKQIF